MKVYLKGFFLEAEPLLLKYNFKIQLEL